MADSLCSLKLAADNKKKESAMKSLIGAQVEAMATGTCLGMSLVRHSVVGYDRYSLMLRKG